MQDKRQHKFQVVIRKVEKGLLINLHTQKNFLLPALEEILVFWKRLVNIIVIESEQHLNKGTLGSTRETTCPGQGRRFRRNISAVLKEEEKFDQFL